MIRLVLAEILRISKLDWRDGGGKKKEKGRRSEGILLCNGLIWVGPSQFDQCIKLSVFWFIFASRASAAPAPGLIWLKKCCNGKCLLP